MLAWCEERCNRPWMRHWVGKGECDSSFILYVGLWAAAAKARLVRCMPTALSSSVGTRKNRLMFSITNWAPASSPLYRHRFFSRFASGLKQANNAKASPQKPKPSSPYIWPWIIYRIKETKRPRKVWSRPLSFPLLRGERRPNSVCVARFRCVLLYAMERKRERWWHFFLSSQEKKESVHKYTALTKPIFLEMENKVRTYQNGHTFLPSFLLKEIGHQPHFGTDFLCLFTQ